MSDMTDDQFDAARERVLRLCPTLGKLWDKVVIWEEGNMAFSRGMIQWGHDSSDEELARIEALASSIPFEQLSDAYSNEGGATMPEELGTLFDGWWV